ncbi:acyltransferase [Vibrio cholerae]|nr:acyltransferase [Vibrio cholerae]
MRKMIRKFYYILRSKLFIWNVRRKKGIVGCGAILNNGNYISPHNITIGKFCYIGPSASLYARGGIDIGDGTIIGPRVIIHTSNHDYNSTECVPYGHNYVHKKVTIGKAVWIGDSVIILPGSSIGDGCIISAGSVVRGNLEPYSIYSGNPAMLISKRKNSNDFEINVKDENFYLKRKL